ncbi:MAG TPA: dodecin family protein [Ignavibacteria bacterium]|jgi:flavin-binding protein dodecin
MQKYFNLVEKVGLSEKSIEEAIENAVLSENSVSWFEVVEIRGRLNQDKKIEYQVKVRIGTKE